MVDVKIKTGSKATLRVLLAAHDTQISRLALKALGRTYRVEHERVDSPDTMRRLLATCHWDLLLCDPMLSHCGCREIVAELREKGSDLLVVALSDDGNERLIGELLGAGVETALDRATLGRLVLIVARRLEDVRNRRLRELQVLIQSSPDPMLIVRADGRVLHANRLVEQLLGYTEVELAGHLIEMLIPDHARAAHTQHRQRYTAMPQARPMGAGVELAARHKSGQEIPVEISLGPVRLAGDSLVCCGVRDLRERKRAESLLRAILEGTAAQVGDEFLCALVKNLAHALDVRYAFISEFPAPATERARVLAFWNGQGFSEPFDYPLAGTPCESVTAASELLIREAVRAHFPGDPRLESLRAESFFGLRLHDSSGQPLGVLAIVDTKPLADEAIVRTVMRIFAARVGTELERLRGMASLVESEERFRSLTELSTDYYWEQDEQMRFVKRIGMSWEKRPSSQESVIGKTRWEVPALNMTEADWTKHRADLDARREFHDLEIGRPLPSGETRWISTSGRPIFDGAGRFRGYRGIGRDITARKIAELALRESETRFRDLVELSSDWYWEQDENFRFVDTEWEPTGTSPLRADVGYAGKTRWEAHPESLPPEQWAAHRRQLEAHEEFRNLEYGRPSRDGRMRWVSVSGRPAFDAEGRFRGYHGIGRDITVRKLAEKALRASEERFRATFEQAAVGMALRSLDGRWLDVNQRLCDILGYTREELLGLTSVDITPAEDRAEAIVYNERMRRGELSTYSREKQYLCKDGTRVWVTITVSVINGQDGKPDRLISVIEDVRERKRAEEDLRARETQLRLVTDNVAAMICYADREFRYRYVNARYAKFFAREPRDFIGRTAMEVIGEAGWQEVGPFFGQALAGKEAYYERSFRDDTGAERTIGAKLVPYEREGAIEGVFALVQDITEQKRNEKSLREHEHELRLIADNVPAMIAYSDAEYRYRYANRQFVEFYSAEGKAVDGRHMAEVLGAAAYAAVRSGVERALAGETVSYEGTRRRRDGELRQVKVTLVPHRENGRVLGTYTFILDVTESWRAAQEVRERDEQLHLVADNVPAMISYIGADCRYRYANLRYREFFSGSGAPVDGRAVGEVLSDSIWQLVRPDVERALAGEPMNYVRRLRRHDGSMRQLDVSLVPHRDDSGRVHGVYSLLLDVTRRRRAEDALRLRSRAIESSVNSIMITEPTDEGQRITYVNPAFERITGYPASEVLGRSPRFLHGDDINQPAIEELRAALHEQREATALLRNYRKDGTLFWNELRVAPVRDESGNVTHFIGVGSDVTERIRYEGEIERNANYDALTGLPNRNLLGDRLAQAIANVERTKSPATVLYIDLDQFKRINDSLGHAIGDQVIASMGTRLAAALRTGDTVARWGGDEFVAVLTNLSHEDDVARIAEKLRGVISAPLRIEAHEFVLTASIGIALAPKDGSDGPMLLRNADAALYRAKEQGRDCFRFFAAEMNEHAVRYLSLEHDLRGALDASEFWLQYQPIVRLATGEAVGAEALIRWRRPDGSVISPAEFIPVAEESGLIVPIGRWVLETAAHQAAAWNRGRQAPLYVSVNLSARQFRDPGLLDMIRAALEGAKLDPSLVKLEITESTVMQNAEDAARTLYGLKDLGVSLSVDDFGTGYSSLSYLKRFPIDTLKIDRSFVRDLPADRDDLAICRAVIDLAQGLGLDVIAEGVETLEQAAMLSTHGCQFAQGYLFSRPVDPGVLEDVVRSRLPVPLAATPGN